jgi:hypothetical protein
VRRPHCRRLCAPTCLRVFPRKRSLCTGRRAISCSAAMLSSKLWYARSGPVGSARPTAAADLASATSRSLALRSALLNQSEAAATHISTSLSTHCLSRAVIFSVAAAPAFHGQPRAPAAAPPGCCVLACLFFPGTTKNDMALGYHAYGHRGTCESQE